MFDESFRGLRWHRLVPPGDRFGVSCDADGPSIGPVRLFERTEIGLRPRPADELDFVLGLALGHPTDFAVKMSGLKAVARALDAGDLARAMIATQLTHLPTLPDDGAFRRAVRADTLAKAGFDPGQPRDDRGRWTADGSSPSADEISDQFDSARVIPVQAVLPNSLIPFLEQILPVEPPPAIPPFPGDILPPSVGNPDIPLPRTLDNPFPKDPECEKEWEDAKRYCNDLDEKGLLDPDPHGDYRGQGDTYEQCVRGQVSARCGGSPVSNEPGTWRRPKNGRGYRGKPKGNRSRYDMIA